MVRVIEEGKDYLYIIEVADMEKVLEYGITGSRGTINCYEMDTTGGCWEVFRGICRDKGVKNPIAVQFKYGGSCICKRELNGGIHDVYLSGYVPPKDIKGWVSVREGLRN